MPMRVLVCNDLALAGNINTYAGTRYVAHMFMRVTLYNKKAGAFTPAVCFIISDVPTSCNDPELVL
jgi:hypothetical protein